MNHTEEERQSMESDLEMTLMLYLAEKEFKADTVTSQGY